MTEKKSSSDLILIALLNLAFLLPFVSKAYVIDDGFSMELAQTNKSFNPFHAHGVYYYGSIELDNQALHTHQIFPSFLWLLIKITGSANEVGMHLCFIIFPLTASFSAYFIAKRFTRSPLWCVLPVVAAPVFVVSAHSIMTDVPQLALWLLSLAVFMSGVDQNRFRRMLLGSLLIPIAALVGYPGLLLAPLFMAYAAVTGNKTIILRSLFTISLGGAVFLLWNVISLYTQGFMPILYPAKIAILVPAYASASQLDWSAVLAKSLSLASNLGGVGLFPLLVIAAFLIHRRARWLVPVNALCTYLILRYLVTDADPKIGIFGYSAEQVALLGFFVFVGSLILWQVLGGGILLAMKIARWTSRDKDTAFLYIWVALVAAYYAFFSPFGAARYMLPMLLPVSMVLIRFFEPPNPDRTRLLRRIAIPSTIGSVVLSIALAIGDYEQAEVYRTFARSDWLEQCLSKVKGRQYVNGELSTRYYLVQRGFRYLAESKLSTAPDGTLSLIRNRPLAEGDCFVRSKESFSPEVSELLLGRSGVPQTLKISKVRWPVRTYCKAARAGFYTHTNGYLPFWFDKTSPLEVFWFFTVKLPPYGSAPDGDKSQHDHPDPATGTSGNPDPVDSRTDDRRPPAPRE